MPHGVRFRKGHGPIPYVLAFSRLERHAAWCSFFGKGMALSLRADIFPFGKTCRMVFVFRKGHGPIPTADIFPFGKTCRMVFVFRKGHGLSLRRTYSRLERHAAWCSFFGKGMALSLRRTYSRSVKHAAWCSFFGKGMALSLRADIFPFGNSCRMVFVFSERAWPYPYVLTFSRLERHSAWCSFFGKGMALSLRADIFPFGNSFRMVFVFRKGHGPIPTADIFPFGKTFCMVFVFRKGHGPIPTC